MSKFDHKRITYWSQLREIPNPSDRIIGTSRVLSSASNIAHANIPVMRPDPNIEWLLAYCAE